MSDPSRPKDDDLERAAEEAVKRFAGVDGEPHKQSDGAPSVEGVAKHLAETLAEAGRKVAAVAEQSLSTAERSLKKEGTPGTLVAIGLATATVVAIAASPRPPRGARLLLYRAHAAAVAFADPDIVGRPRSLTGFGFFVGLAAGIAIATLKRERSNA